MNYNEALEKANNMAEMAGMHVVIVESKPDFYYVDYKHNNSMLNPFNISIPIRNNRQFELKSCYIDSFMLDLSTKINIQTPPKGRSQKSHNLIQSMNKKSRY